MATYSATTESVSEEVAFNIDQAIKKTQVSSINFVYLLKFHLIKYVPSDILFSQDRNHLRRRVRKHLNVLILHAENLETRNEVIAMRVSENHSFSTFFWKSFFLNNF